MAGNTVHAIGWHVNAVLHNVPFADDKNRYLWINDPKRSEIPAGSQTAYADCSGARQGRKAARGAILLMVERMPTGSGLASGKHMTGAAHFSNSIRRVSTNEPVVSRQT
jgi:hypothetical protein